MTPKPRRFLSRSVPLSLGALAATTLLGLIGCVADDAADPDLAVARTTGPLTATPGAAALGTFRLGSTGSLSLTLANTGRSDITIRAITLVPPIAYAPGYVPPAPCLPPDPYVPPDPYRTPPAIPPDPYHNPPDDHAPERDLITRLIVPCVRPDSTTTVVLGFNAISVGGFAAGVNIEYGTADGAAFTLTVPAAACTVR